MPVSALWCWATTPRHRSTPKTRLRDASPGIGVSTEPSHTCGTASPEGYQSSNENALGNHFCVPASGRFAANKDIETGIVEAMGLWMGSSGHRANILNPRHKKVSLGLAWNSHNARFYQNFEGDHVSYGVIPNIKGGVLSLEGTGKNGVQFVKNRDLGVSISYDSDTNATHPGATKQNALC